PLPVDRALARVLAQRLLGVRRYQRHRAVAGKQPLDLLEAHLAAAYHHAAAAGELQAGNVEGGLEHPPSAALGAGALAQLAHALLAGIGLGGHSPKSSEARANGRYPGTSRPSARAPSRIRAGAPSPRARLRSDSRPERIFATTRAARVLSSS